jgi:hypothetical protein
MSHCAMALLGHHKRKPDPISDRAKHLNQKISALEGEIQRLSNVLEQSKTQPRMRSTAYPPGHSSPGATVGDAAPTAAAPIFEKLDHGRIHEMEPEVSTPEHFNELGIRKFDLVALWQRFRRHFQSSEPTNPKLVHLMAAGTVQGLKPLRIEKRIARRRFLLLVGVLLALLWGLACLFF